MRNILTNIRSSQVTEAAETEIYTDNEVLFTDNENVYTDGILINL